MHRTAEAPGLVLAAGLAVVVVAAIAPTALGGRAVPALSWGVWAATLAAALAAFALGGVPPLAALRRLAWALPVVALLAIPAAAVSPPGTRSVVAASLAARAFASVAAAAALASWLGAPGLVAGLRRLRTPERLVEVLAATLAGLAVVTRQAAAMTRARAARRPGHGAFARVLASPAGTIRGFGRLVAALLLRSLERGEALERARRVRGGRP